VKSVKSHHSIFQSLLLISLQLFNKEDEDVNENVTMVAHPGGNCHVDRIGSLCIADARTPDSSPTANYRSSCRTNYRARCRTN